MILLWNGSKRGLQYISPSPVYRLNRQIGTVESMPKTFSKVKTKPSFEKVVGEIWSASTSDASDRTVYLANVTLGFQGPTTFHMPVAYELLLRTPPLDCRKMNNCGDMCIWNLLKKHPLEWWITLPFVAVRRTCLDLETAFRTIFVGLCRIYLNTLSLISITVWSFFSWCGLDPLVLIIGDMDADVYKTVLDNSRSKRTDNSLVFGPHCIQQDSALCQAACFIKMWFQ